MAKARKDQFYQKWWFWVIVGILALVVIGNVINQANNSCEDIAQLTLDFQELGYATCLINNDLVDLANLQASVIDPNHEDLNRFDCESQWYIEEDSELKQEYNPDGDRSP